jgi:hypothetical protein
LQEAVRLMIKEKTDALMDRDHARGREPAR